MVHFMAYRATEKTRSKKADTRKRILEECYQLVRKQGFRGVSVTKVAERADIATGSIYRHFPSKADLVAEIFRYCTQHEVEAVARAASSTEKPTENLRAAVEQFCIRAINGRRLAWALIAEPVDPQVEKERLAYRYAYTEIFEDLITEGIERSEFMAQNPTLTASAIVGVLGEVLLEPLGRGDIARDSAAVTGDATLPTGRFIEDIVRLIDRMVGANTEQQSNVVPVVALKRKQQ